MTEIEELQHDIERHQNNLASAEMTIDRMKAILIRIDAINDNPACFNSEINDLCGAILRPHLYQQETKT